MSGFINIVRLLKCLVDGNFDCKFYKFIKPKQEQLQKIQL
jgi:hypothetical protein